MITFKQRCITLAERKVPRFRPHTARAYTLILQSPEGSGSTDPPTGSYTYQNPVRVAVKAAPTSGWIFDHWILDGTDAGKSNPREVVMNANHSVKAVFVASGSNPSSGIPSYPLESVIIGIILCLALITHWLSLHN